MKCHTATRQDYLVINDVFDTALIELQAIISAARLRTGRQQAAHTALLRDLLTPETTPRKTCRQIYTQGWVRLTLPGYTMRPHL